MVGVKSRTTIHRYLSGERLPSPEVALRIYEATDGQVAFRDFVVTYQRRGNQADSNEKAHAHENHPEEFPWSRLEAYAERKTQEALEAMLKEPPEEDRLSPPVAKAIDLLGERVSVNARQTRFKLDGRPAGLKEIMRAANTLLKVSGMMPIAYPGVQLPGDGA